MNYLNALNDAINSTMEDNNDHQTKEKLKLLKEKTKDYRNDFELQHFAKFISDIYKLNNLSLAVDLLSKVDFKIKTKKVKTIGTYYTRMYNGGTEKVLSQLMSIWADCGYKVILFTEEPEKNIDFPYPDTVKRIVIPGLKNPNNRLVELEQELIQNNIDIFINHQWVDNNIYYDCALCHFHNIPYINFAHGLFSTMFLSPNLEYPYEFNKVFRRFDLVISLSSITARYFQINKINSYLYNNPIPQELLNTIKRKKIDDKVHILWVGRIREDKNPQDAIKCFKLLCNKCENAVLDFVGDGPEKTINELKSFINDNNLNDKVIFHGYDNNTAKYYSYADILLFTSKQEGYAVVLAEAKAYGIPIVMYDLTYLTPIKDKLGVLISKLDDINGMSKNLFKLTQDNSLRSQLSKESLLSFKKLCDYDQVQAWNDIFNLGTKNNRKLKYNNNHYEAKAEDNWEKFIIDEIFTGAQFNKIESNNVVTYTIKSTPTFKMGKLILWLPRKTLWPIYKKIRKKGTD